jgi:hypothetical protein
MRPTGLIISFVKPNKDVYVNIKHILIALVMAVIAVSPSSYAKTFMGKEVRKQEFRISNGQSIELPVTDDGPIPAAQNGIKVEFSGPIFGPSKTDARKVEMMWAFSVSTLEPSSYRSVVVENVSAETAQTVLEHENQTTERLLISQ